jgi:hypothetical protein
VIPNLPSGSIGLLNETEFNFTTLIPSNSTTNPLPQAILVQGHIFGKNLNFQLTQIVGGSSLILAKVYKSTGQTVKDRNNFTSTVNAIPLKNLVSNMLLSTLAADALSIASSVCVKKLA